MTKAGPEEQGQIKAREEKYQIRTVVCGAVIKVEADLGQTKRMARKRTATQVGSGQGKAKAGRSMIG